MLKIKRILTDEELRIFVEIREKEGNKKAAKYMKSLQEDLFEVVDERYGNSNKRTGK